MLLLIESVGYPRGFLSFHDLGILSSWGGPVTLVRLVSRPRPDLSVVAVLPRAVVWLSEGSTVVRPPIPLVASDIRCPLWWSIQGHRPI